MSDLTNAASNAASEENSVVDTVDVAPPATAEAQPQPVPQSAGEAIDQAFAELDIAAKPLQNRAPDGKYAKGTSDAPGTAAQPVAPKSNAVAQQPSVQSQVGSSAAQTNYGLTKETQAVWATLPEGVRKDVERRFTELTAGIEKHRASSEAFAPVERFHKMALEGGTTLENALTSYTNLEDMLRAQPVRGMFEVCKNLGVDPKTMAMAMLQQAEAGVTGQPPQQQKAMTPEEARALAREEAAHFHAERDTLAQVEKFRADHPRFDELEEEILQQIAHPVVQKLPRNERLQAAYERAERLNPVQPAPNAPVAPANGTPVQPSVAAAQPAAIQAVQPANDKAEVQTKAKLSIGAGSPSGSSPKKTHTNARSAIDEAFAEAGLT